MPPRTLLATVVLGWATISHAFDERIEVEAEAPPKHEILRHTTGGAYFVAKGLKKKYDDLVGRVRTLREQVADQHVPTEDALIELESLTIRLDALRKEIETKKVHVQPMRAHTRTTETTFELGSERMLIVTGDLVRIRGWDGPGVKVVVEKTVYDAEGEEPEAGEFDAMKVVHRHGVATELVGKPRAEADAEEAAYLESDEGRKLNDEQRANRAELVREIQDSYLPYARFQGREVDAIELEGLTQEQGNRYFSMKIKSPDGGGTYGGDWRRHARTTVFVPPCNGVLLRGCLVGLDVENLAAPLVVTSSGSRDRDYDGEFGIAGLNGSLDLYNVPLDRLENVRGNVTITSTVDRGNSGNSHSGGRWTSYVPPASPTVVRGVVGDLSLWFARGELDVSGVTGTIDVRNEFGNTRIALAQPLPDAAHRVVTESGRIEVDLAEGTLGKLPLFAVTNHGTVRTNAGRDRLDDTSFTTGNSHGGQRRNWRGMVSATESRDPFASFHRMKHPAAILDGAKRKPGLDLISRAGTIVVTFAEE